LKGDYDKAVADFSAVIRLNPKLARAYSDRGEAYRLKGDFRQSRADFQAALVLDPKHSKASTGIELIDAVLQIREAQSRDQPAASPLASVPTQNPGGDWVACSGGLSGSNVDRLQLQFDACQRIIAAGTEPKHIVDVAREIVSKSAGATNKQGIYPTSADSRVALVIGNRQYAAVGQLPNAKRDAEAIAQAFRNIGFKTVQVENDVDRDSLIKALRRFEEVASNADWSVVYYAGHGIEVAGQNYLVPVDAHLRSDKDVQDEAVPLAHSLGYGGCEEAAARHP
jgi:tetratricopeptide (TPR) repeat protein